MALGTLSASIGGVAKTLITAQDGSSNVAIAHLNVDASGAPIGVPGNPVATADSNNAGIQGVVAIAPGTATTAQRALGYVCTAAGAVTLTLADASTITVPIAVNGGAFQSMPFAVTNLALGAGTAGTFWGLK